MEYGKKRKHRSIQTDSYEPSAPPYSPPRHNPDAHRYGSGSRHDVFHPYNPIADDIPETDDDGQYVIPTGTDHNRVVPTGRKQGAIRNPYEYWNHRVRQKKRTGSRFYDSRGKKSVGHHVLRRPTEYDIPTQEAENERVHEFAESRGFMRTQAVTLPYGRFYYPQLYRFNKRGIMIRK